MLYIYIIIYDLAKLVPGNPLTGDFFGRKFLGQVTPENKYNETTSYRWWFQTFFIFTPIWGNYFAF